MTMIPTTLLLITTEPSHPLAPLALRYAQAFLKQDSLESDQLRLFFYADAAHTANGLRWQSADQLDITKQWQQLAKQYQLELPVCVSTALARGVADSDNSRRHNLSSMLTIPQSEVGDTETALPLLSPSNIASGFNLVGLSELATRMKEAQRIIQF